MKNFIRGMGVGILVTTLIFAIAYMLNGDDISDDVIRERAGKLGMVEQDQTVIAPTVEPEATQPVPDNRSDAGQTPAVSESGTVPEPEPVQNTASGNAILVQIPRGQDGITISNMLQEKGVISDAADFNRYLSQNRLQMNIMYGEFTLEPNMPYEAIVEKIVRK